MQTPITRQRKRSALVVAIALAVVALGMALCVVWAASSPDDGTDAKGMAVTSFGALTVLSLVLSFGFLASYLWPPKPPVGPVAGWYANPTGESTWRYWDGSSWTDFTG